jgi:hypothetical protein
MFSLPAMNKVHCLSQTSFCGLEHKGLITAWRKLQGKNNGDESSVENKRRSSVLLATRRRKD